MIYNPYDQVSPSGLSLVIRGKGRPESLVSAVTGEIRRLDPGQVITDVRDAYEGLQTSDRVVKLYRSGNLEISQKNRGISEYAYQRGATSLLDYLDAERSYRATQLAYRQAVAAYLLALEQLYQAVGTRSLL